MAPYLARVTAEVLPWVAATYGAAGDARRTAFGGSSFGGVCALWAAMHYPQAFSAVLVESPSLWFADERFFREEVATHTGPWPDKMFVGMGTREFSGTRPGQPPAEAAKWDALLVSYCRELAEMLAAAGLDGSRLKWQVCGSGGGGTGLLVVVCVEDGAVDARQCWAVWCRLCSAPHLCSAHRSPPTCPRRPPHACPPFPPPCLQIGEGAAHTESAWAERLPGALTFLLQPWWADTMARHSQSLFFTSPRKLQAGQPAVLFVNRQRSHALAGGQGGHLQVRAPQPGLRRLQAIDAGRCRLV